MMPSPLDAVQVVRELVALVGDAKAWRLEIRKWAFAHMSDLTQAESLEAWVRTVDAPIIGPRRTALRMWAYDQCANLLDDVDPQAAAGVLYDWAVLAEGRDTGETDG